MNQENPEESGTQTADKSPKPSDVPLADDALARVAKATAALPAVPPMDAQTRFAACSLEINAILKKHRCRIMPAINPPETVGSEPTNKILITASWGIMPDP